MARQPGTGSAEEPKDAIGGGPESDDVGPADDESLDVEDLDAEDLAAEELDAADLDPDDEVDAAGADDRERSAATDAFWSEVRVAPVEIALRDGVGYTLRAYRLSSELTPPKIGEREDEFRFRRADDLLADEAEVEIDEDELARQALAAGRGRAEGASGRRGVTDRADSDDDEDDSDDDLRDDEDLLDEDDETDRADEDDDTADSVEDKADEDDGDHDTVDDDGTPEEVPVFLGPAGRLYLFRTPEALVDFVRSDDEHELAQLDTWSKVRERIEPADVVPLAEDRYELDLVVSNLRGGHDTWEPALIIQAGEAARDIAYALRLESVISAVSPGSSLDELDDALRAAESRGLSGFFARRRVRRIGAEAAAIGWRTIIGKISAAVDWRD